MNQPYYMPKPIEPSKDWIARLLGASLVISVIGLSIYGLFAFAFDDIEIIPDAVQSILVVIGSALIVVGAEMNTPPTLVAVWRKAGREKATWIDYTICTLSLIGGIAGVLVVFSIRQTLFGEDGWRAWTSAVGPLFVGVTIVIDYYGCAAELGLLRSDYDAEMREWLEAEQEWNQTHDVADEILPSTQSTNEQIRDIVFAAYASDSPPTNYAEFGATIGKSASTVGYHVRALREAGKLNGRHN